MNYRNKISNIHQNKKINEYKNLSYNRTNLFYNNLNELFF